MYVLFYYFFYILIEVFYSFVSLNIRNVKIDCILLVELVSRRIVKQGIANVGIFMWIVWRKLGFFKQQWMFGGSHLSPIPMYFIQIAFATWYIDGGIAMLVGVNLVS